MTNENETIRPYLLFEQYDELEFTSEKDNKRWNDLVNAIQEGSTLSESLSSVVDNKEEFTLSDSASVEDVQKIDALQHKLQRYVGILNDRCADQLRFLSAVAKVQVDLRRNAQDFLFSCCDLMARRPEGVPLIGPEGKPRIDLFNAANPDLYGDMMMSATMDTESAPPPTTPATDNTAPTTPITPTPSTRIGRQGKKRRRPVKSKVDQTIAITPEEKIAQERTLKQHGFINPFHNIQTDNH